MSPRIDRSAVIDLCRGLLFVLMANTHALTIASVPKSHALYSDIWLPNGWATVVFVVLSGYGVGYIYSIRLPETKRDADLLRRGWQIFAVMFGSNFVFALLRQIAAGEGAAALAPVWWVGLFTYDTEWTISGVLLPTALVLLTGPIVIRFVHRAPWISLLTFVLARVLVAVAVEVVHRSPHSQDWVVRFLLLEGFGGFPVVPFVLNGCLGVWLGMQCHRSPYAWRVALAALLALQLLAYLLTYGGTGVGERVFISSVSAVGKFAWVFLAAHLLVATGWRWIVEPIALAGRYALGSFVMHRVFLQGLGIVFGVLGFMTLAAPVRYVVLFGGTLVLTWGLCFSRERYRVIDAALRRVWI